MSYSWGIWAGDEPAKGREMMIDSYSDRTLATAGDDYTEADLWDVYMEERAAEYRREHGAYAVPSKELIKQWAREAQASTQAKEQETNGNGND